MHACAVCQLGGLIYFTLLGIIVLVLINFLPLVNFLFTLLFDGCIACIDLTTTKEGRKKVGAGVSMARAAAKTARQGGRTRFGASGDGPRTFDASNVHLTAQQVRSLKRGQRVERDYDNGAATTGASFVQRLRRVGSHIVNMGEPTVQEGQSLLQSQADGASLTASPPPSPPPPPRPRPPPPPHGETWA